MKLGCFFFFYWSQIELNFKLGNNCELSREIFNRPFLKVLQPSSMGNIFLGKRNFHSNSISYFHSILYLFLNRKYKVLTHMSQPLVKFMFLAPYLPSCCYSESWVLKLFLYILIDMFQELKKEEENLQGSFSSPSVHHHTPTLPLHARKWYFFYPFSFSYHWLFHKHFGNFGTLPG